MTTLAQTADTPSGWLKRAEAWLDEKGKGAWIAAAVLGFFVFWPVGLALLAYMIWSKRMFTCKNRQHHRSYRAHRHSSGNSVFDAYREETLRRLEDEQREFQDFLNRLREAKDKAEFDQFMDERSRAAKNASDNDAMTQASPA